MSACGDGRTEAEERADDSRMIAEGMRAAFPPLTEAEYAATLPERIGRVVAEINERLGPLTDLRFEFDLGDTPLAHSGRLYRERLEKGAPPSSFSGRI